MYKEHVEKARERHKNMPQFDTNKEEKEKPIIDKFFNYKLQSRLFFI